LGFSNNITLASSKALVLTDNSTNTVSLQASNSTTSYTLKLPTTQSSGTQVLTNDGSGNLSWTAGGGTGSAAFREDYVVGTALNNYTGSTTVFNLVNSYVVGGHSLIVTLDGDVQTVGATIDYLETNSTTVTFNNALVVGEKVSFIFQTPTTSGGTVNTGTSGQIAVYNGTNSVTSGVTASMNNTKITGLANGTASTDAAAFGQIKVLQTITATSTTSFSTTSTSYVTTNLSASITPTSASNRILIIASGDIGSNVGTNQIFVTLARNGVNILNANGITGPQIQIAGYYDMPVTVSYVDSPASTSSLTYAIQIKGSASNAINFGSGTSTQSITLVEVV